MKHKIKWMWNLLVIVGFLFCITPITAEPTINGTGASGMSTNSCGVDNLVCWPRVYHPDGIVVNDDGVRITLMEVDENGNVIRDVGHIDYSNQTHDGILLLEDGTIHSNKYWYMTGAYTDSLYIATKKPNGVAYENNVPTIDLPWIVRASDGANNMEAVRDWFRDENTIEMVARDLGMSCSDATDPTRCELTSLHENGKGKYKLLLEPIAYVELKIQGSFYKIAITPTEMAMYDSIESSKPFYTWGQTMLYTTFAKGMFLQQSDLGFGAYTPSGGAQSINTIKQYLGMAIISFDQEIAEPEPEDGPVEIEVEDAKYRTNTEVYSTFKITSASDRPKDNSINYKMVLSSNNQTLCSDTVEAAAGEPQLAWCKWTTSSRTGADTIKIYLDNQYVKSMDITVSSLENLDPPDTNADDQKPRGWNLVSISEQVSDSNTWSIWYSVKQTDIKTLEGTPGGWNYTKIVTYNYTYIPGNLASCSIEGNTTKEACLEAGGAWTSATSGYYRNNGSTNSYEDIENFYKFYRFGSHKEVSSSCTGSHTNGNRVCKYVYEGVEDTSKPFIDKFRATLESTTKLSHDVNNKTAVGLSMKSGYGVSLVTKNAVSVQRVSTSGYGGSGYEAEMTDIQTGVASYPEFEFSDYYTLLEGTTKMQLPKNSASVTKERVHFTPIWYPDNKRYPIKVKVLDAWTPGGMLNTTTSDYKIIRGNMWEDVQIVVGKH